MFLASSCNDDPKSSLHGRIFACPLANQKVTKPFEILDNCKGYDGHLLKDHENIEIHLLSQTSAIITGYKFIEKDKKSKKKDAAKLEMIEQKRESSDSDSDDDTDDDDDDYDESIVQSSVQNDEEQPHDKEAGSELPVEDT